MEKQTENGMYDKIKMSNEKLNVEFFYQSILFDSRFSQRSFRFLDENFGLRLRVWANEICRFERFISW